jgi:phosphatidate cytidylyltransferase
MCLFRIFNFIINIIMQLNKITMGLIISIVTFICFKAKKINVIVCVSLIIGLYELIQNMFNINNKIILLFSVIIIIICSDMISNEIITNSDIVNIIIIVITSDIFQELSGKLFGKTKIGWISPNKSIEGYIGGYIGILSYYFIAKPNFIFINTIYMLGIMGDLYFSYIKRILQIKDYSDILLSHGGMLDRIDSVIFAILGYGLYKQCNIIKNS